MRWRALARLAREAWGLPRHPSQHPGGMVISTRPLIDICPVQPAAMEGRQLVQWDKDSCADAGFLKIDLLGLGMLSAVERCVEEIARARGERIDLSRIPMDDPQTFRAIRAADTTGAFQIESRAQMQMLPRTPARDPRRPHGPGGAGAPGADPGRRRASLPGAPRAAAQGPLVPRPLRAPLAGADPARHAGDDRLPGAGDPGGDGAGRVQRRRGRGAAPGDEPQALRGGDPRLSRAVHRRGERARRDAGGGGARLRAGPRLLGVRVPEGPRGGLRPARLPVDLASGPLRPRVPLLAPERAADGLLPARRAGARGAAQGDRGAAARRRTAAAVECVGRGSRGARGGRRADRPGLHNRPARRRTPGRWSTERERRGPYADLADLASRSGVGDDGLELLAWAGACEGIGGRDDLRRREDLWRLGVARGGRRRRRGPSSSPFPSPSPRRHRCASSTRGSGWSPTTRPRGSRSPSTRCRCCGPASAERVAYERGPRSGPGRRAVGGRRDGRRTPAAGDRARRRLHAARGRAGHDQRGRPAAGLRSGIAWP